MARNVKGFALLYVLIAMFVLLVFGTVLLKIGTSQSAHAAFDKNKMQAYYLARSGALATASWLLSPSGRVEDVLGKTSIPQALAGSDINGSYIVEVSGNTGSLVLVKSVGTVQNTNATATIALRSNGDILTSPVFDDTVYAKRIIVLDGNVTIVGNIGYGESLVSRGKALTISGISIQKTKNLPSPIMPADPSTATSLSYNASTTIDLTSRSDQMLIVKDFKFNRQNGVFTVKTGVSGNIVRIVAETFDMELGTLSLTGLGRLEIYVTKSMSLKGGAINPGGSAKRLMVLLDKGASFGIFGNPVFCGVIYGPEAVVTIGGTGEFTGAIIAGTSGLSGNPFTGTGDAGDLTYDDLPISIFNDSVWVNN